MELRDDLAGLVEDVQSLGFKVERAEDHPWPRDPLTRGAMRGVKRAYLGRPRILGGRDSGGTGVSSSSGTGTAPPGRPRLQQTTRQEVTERA
jgi:hypothetical protein